MSYWVVQGILSHVVLAKVRHKAQFSWGLIWCSMGGNVQSDLSHMPGALVLTVSWDTTVLFCKDYLSLMLSLTVSS